MPVRCLTCFGQSIQLSVLVFATSSVPSSSALEVLVGHAKMLSKLSSKLILKFNIPQQSCTKAWDLYLVAVECFLELTKDKTQ